MPGLSEATWGEIEAMRAEIASGKPTSVLEAADRFTELFATRFSTVVLARLFLVVPHDRLPPADRHFARTVTGNDPRLTGTTPVLSLLGTHGREPEWNDRMRSVGHLAIPLLDREGVQAAPMIARLLVDLELDIEGPDAGESITTRRMVGGRTAMFYVPDAPTARDDRGRPIIQPEFVARHAVESVFGMGGSYLDGSLVIAIVFCTERIERADADRYGSFINSFKMATLELVDAGRIWSP